MNLFIPNSFGSIGKKLFVAQRKENASDDNPGTEEKPFRTITRAASIMEMCDEIIIGEGVYREEIPLKVNGHHYVPEFRPVFRAAEGEKVWIKGSNAFTPEWKNLSGCIYRAPLPRHLFETGAYNPYKLDAAIDNPCEVRPCPDDVPLPETLGQLFCDGTPMRQVDSTKKLTPGSWLVTAEGKKIMAAFDKPPENFELELTVRQRCLKPEFKGTVFIDVIGIRVEDAAEPGPFCLCRPKNFRKNSEVGITVIRTFNLPGTTTRQCRLFCGEVSYISNKCSRLRTTVYDDSIPSSQCYVYDVISDDHALTWQRISENRPAAAMTVDDIFLDEKKELLINTKIEYLPDSVPISGCSVTNRGKIKAVSRISPDNGKNWELPETIGMDIIPFRLEKLPDETFLLPCARNTFPNGNLHQDAEIYSGRLKKASSGMEWRHLATLSVKPEESACGLSEPRLARFPDGKLMLLLRAGAILPAQDRNGVPSVKLYSISNDNGKTWSHPEPLLFDDGTYVYSPRSYQDLFQSIKNGRVYAILNTCAQPTSGCDPRTKLEIMEIDTETLRVKRNTVAVIEEKHSEAHHLVRYSNWLMFQNRKTLNPVILMRQHMSEYCPIRHGYDLSSYRYEINLPENTL